MTTDEYVDYFLELNDGNARAAIAWLIGRMDGAEREVVRAKKTFERMFNVRCFEECQLKTTLELIAEEKG